MINKNRNFVNKSLKMVDKKELIQKIEDLDDEQVLNDLNQIIDFHNDNEKIYDFTDEEIELIKISEKQISEGKFKSHSEVIKLSQQWLEK
jgi:hypothetical protein